MTSVPTRLRTGSDRQLLELLDRIIASEPAEAWNAREWGGVFLDDLTSPATGEQCEARLRFTHHGQPVALLEVRPYQRQAAVIDRTELHYWLTLGKRKPKPYYFFAKAMDAAMGMRSRSIWERPGYDRYFHAGDLRVLRRLYEIDFRRDAQQAQQEQEASDGRYACG